MSAKLSLHNLKNVNTVLSMLYDKDGNYRAGFSPDEFYNTILLDTLKYGEENYVHLKYAENLTIKILAETIGKSVPELMGKFLLLGMMVNINSNIDFIIIKSEFDNILLALSESSKSSTFCVIPVGIKPHFLALLYSSKR